MIAATGRTMNNQTNASKASRRILFFTTILFGTCLCLGCFLASSLPLYKTLDQPTAEQGQQKADGLIKALERYKNETGVYPSDVDLLVPNYLDTIPQPAWNTRYDYELQSEGDEFILYFDVGISIDGDYCEYSSRTRSWYCSDKI